MWWRDIAASRRGARAGALCLMLVGCGFEPALAPDGPARALTGRVELNVPEGRLGFALRDALVARVGRATPNAPYRLEADLEMVESGLAISTDSAINRYVLRGVSRFRMDGPEGFAPIEGEVRTLSSYSAAGSLYATRAAQRDAEARVARDLGDRIADQAVATLADRQAAD